ncbi:uncharacterized protein LOC122505782 [Leptopilina heterotoma]|uniref:uncharacterized protein LOC122505782 n=1 Tax=Leptopilina heterotoma TaxID=63436 RepID=UPI001CA7E83B|nr:uncharacterized protein LOC122505782 [Leptopilina heterotoma]
MAKEFMEDVSQTSTSSTAVPTMSVGTTTVASSISNLPTVSTNTESINSTNSALQKIDDSKEMKSESLEQIETSRNMSWAPPITSDVITTQPSRSVSSKLDLVESSEKNDNPNNNKSSSMFSINIEIKSNNDSNKITEIEMKSLVKELRKAKKIVKNLFSTEEEKNIKLTESLENIFSFVIKTRTKMTKQQATLINDVLRSILKRRRKLEMIPSGWIFYFLTIIMLLRMFCDIFSTVQVIKSGLIFSKIFLLTIDLLGCVFTILIMMSFCWKSPVQAIDLFFCIIWTMLYGIITTVVIVTSPITPVSIIICGYMSMLTCIVQGGIKMFFNYWKKSNRSKHVCNGDCIVDNTKNVRFSAINVESSYQDSQSRNEIDPFTIYPGNNHFDSRINAIKKLEHTIKVFLVEIHGADYINKERFHSVENLNYKNQYELQNVRSHVGTNEAVNSNINDNYIYNNNFNGVDCCFCCIATDPHPNIFPVWLGFGNSGCCDGNDNNCCGDCDCGGCDCGGCDCGDCICLDCICGSCDCVGVDCVGCCL